MSSPPPVPAAAVRDPDAAPHTLNPFDWIDWVIAAIHWFFAVVWNFATTPILATRYFLGYVADAAVTAWKYLTGASSYLATHDVSLRNIVKLGVLPYARTGLTLAQQGFAFLNQYLVSWARPHAANLANLGIYGLGPLGKLLGEMLGHTVLIRDAAKLQAPVFTKLAEATESLVAAVETRVGEAFKSWEPSLNLSIAWSNWLLEPAGRLRSDPWLASLIAYAGDTFGGLLSSLWSGQAREITAAQLNAAFPLRPAQDVVAAFYDGRTASLAAVRDAVARFNAGG